MNTTGNLYRSELQMMRKFLFALAALLGATAPAFAVCGTLGGSCFWVGGTGTWDSTTKTHWSDTTGGAGGSGPPSTQSPVTFDTSSCGAACTITLDSSINGLTFGTLVDGSCTNGCVIDNSVNNVNLTFLSSSFATGTGTRTFHCGTGTITLTAISGTPLDLSTNTNLTWDCPNGGFTFAAASAPNARAFQTGGKTFGTVTLTGGTGTGASRFQILGSPTFNNWAVTGPMWISVTQGSTLTVTNAFALAGTSTNPIFIDNDNNANSATATIHASAASTMTWVGIHTMIVGTSAVTMSNCLDLGGNTFNNGSACTAPTGGGGGGGGHIIGG